MRFSLLFTFFVALLPSSLLADQLVVSRIANIKEQPEKDGRVIVKVPVDTILDLLDDGQQVQGYYHVLLPGNEQDGWVYRNRVQRSPSTQSTATANTPPSSLNTIALQSPLCLYGCPIGAPATNDIIIRDIYILSNNRNTKFADWVAYKVSADNIGTTKTRVWKIDPDIYSNFTLGPEDYRSANALLGTDRGHQAPLASFTGTTYWPETNYLSNITPQKSALNQGSWQILERRVRTLAKKYAKRAVVYVATGPLYERVMPALPFANKPHVVPSAYWKVVAVDSGTGLRVAAFYFDQDTDRGDDICQHALPVDEIEFRSGLDLYSGLDDHIESVLEGTVGSLTTELGC